MKFGGSQLGAAGRAVGEGLGAHAVVPRHRAARWPASRRRSGGATRSGSTRRRRARRELAQLDKSITAAEIRRDIAVHSLEVHERTVAQTEEMFEFFRERFTSVDRYRLLVEGPAPALQGRLRLGVCGWRSMAEQAYRAERQDDGPTDDDDLLAGGYWDAQNAGLLAGEKLLTDLQRLERQYVERNTASSRSSTASRWRSSRPMSSPSCASPASARSPSRNGSSICPIRGSTGAGSRPCA